MGNIRKEELLLAKELFNIIIFDEAYVRVSTSSMTFVDEEVSLSEIRREIESMPGEVSFVKQNNLFDQLIVERLNVSGTNFYEYIFNTLDRISHAEGKAWNQSALHQDFIQNSKKILYNYLNLSLLVEDMFPSSNMQVAGTRFSIEVNTQDDNMRIAYKLIQLFFWRMPADLFLFTLKSLDNHRVVLDNIFKCIYRKFENLNALDPLCADIIEFLLVILNDDAYVGIIFTIPWAPAIAGPNRSKLTEIADAKCRLIEDYSFLGSLFRHSILPNSIKDQMAAQSFIQNISSKITACKSKGDFQKTIDNYNRAYKSYEAKLLALVKLLIKQSPAETFKFMAACIRGNMDKIRLGSMLQQATLNSFASASFSLTFYDILLELVKPVLAKPELMAKADPDFFYSLKQEFRYSDVDPIKTEVVSPPTAAASKEFGTVTKFYFYALECVRLHFVPIMNEILQAFNDFQRMEERAKSLPSNHPHKDMIAKRLKMMEQQLMVYRVIIEDKERIRSTNDLLNNFQMIFLDWCGVGKNSLKPDEAKNGLLSFIPSYYLTNTVEFHQIYMNFENSLTNNIPPSYFPNFIRLVELVLSKNLFSNKHHKNKIMELMVFYIMVNKDFIYSVVKNETVNHSDMMKGLLNYFSEVEFSGEEGAFYSKFKFRSGLMQLLDKMWSEPFFRNITVGLKKTEEFNRFVGHIITDLNYCMDEGFQKVPKYKELHSQKTALNEEQLQELSTTKRIIKFSFSMGKDTLKILRMLTEMTPDTFDTEDWRKKFSQVINYYAQKLSTKNFKMYKIDNAKKLGLHPLQMITDLVNIYINVASYDGICKEICDDERSYSDDLLIDLGKTSKKHSLLTEDQLTRMENLINKLIELQNAREEMKRLLEDLPDDYSCQLTYEFMRDPVKLPNSGCIVDRKSIKQHIMLNGNSDPFSRQALKLEECLEMPELKAQIDAWYNQKVSQLNLPKKGKVQIKNGMDMEDPDDVFHNQNQMMEEEQNDFLGGFGRGGQFN